MTVYRWGPIRTLLVLAPVLLGAPYLAYRHHICLPTPVVDLVNPQTGLPQLSEASILGHAKFLSEDIGYRTVGTVEHAAADAWMVDTAKEIRSICQTIVQTSGGKRKLECEVWRQQGNGYHRFDIMHARLYKTYVNLSNIIIRISDGTPEGKKHAVLVNSHLDSTLPSPGAADDALAVGVMLDCIRVLVNTPDWTPSHAVIFLFNHAEESLQDGSQLYATQHETAPTVRAVVNLEAAGTRGKEILFQATSEEMINAYSHVPRPFGTIFASDVFALGILQSDTDFRQFQYYLNVTGLDMAVIGNGYLYHMRKDLVENIQPGVAQNMGENALALVTYLTSSQSPLPSLTGGYVKPQTTYITFFGLFVQFSFTTAKLFYGTLCLGSMGLVQVMLNPGSGRRLGPLRRAATASVLAFVGALIVPNIVALAMTKVVGRPMSWFSREWLPVVLYAPPAFLGVLLSQLTLITFVGPISETSLFSALLLIQSFLALFVQLAGVGSAILFFILAASLFLAFALNPVFLAATSPPALIVPPNPRDLAAAKADRQRKKEQMKEYAKIDVGTRVKNIEEDQGYVSLWTYALGQVLPLAVGTLIALPTLETFVPLMGRVGPAPSDNIVATLVALLSTATIPLAVPFTHRFSKEGIRQMILVTSIIVAAEVAIFAQKEPYDTMHPKRMYIFSTENITSHEHHLHIAQSDSGPHFEPLVRDLANQFALGEQHLESVVMDDHNPDWDPIHPFSLVLAPYKVPLAIEPGYISPWTKPGKTFRVSLTKDSRDLAESTRSFTLKVDHPGLIWTVIAFDAHVLSWDLDDNPPSEYTRHHIKEASFHGSDSYEISMKIKETEESGTGLKINFIGVQEKAMWPGKQKALAKTSRQEPGGLALALFAEIDAWLEKRTGGCIDATMLGAVAGVVVV